MNRLAPLFCICYDLSDDHERHQLAKVLQAYGERVQYSVFECHLTRSSAQRLHQQLRALQLKSGHVRCYRADYRQTKHYGQPPNDANASHAYIL